MADILFWGLLFVISLAILIKASDEFTEAAEKLGIYFGVPAFIVGVTIVSIGTSLPEIISSIIAVLQDSSEIVIGNVVGSNIANICLVVGVAAIIKKQINVTYEIIHVDLPFLVGSAFLLAATVYDGLFTFGEAILCLGTIGLYIHYTINVERELPHEDLEEEVEEERMKRLEFWTLAKLVLSAFFIYIGAKFTIDSVINISDILNIGKEIIAVTAVALGTSLPELSVTLTAARKGKSEIALGNVLGSNIYNSLAVMGIPALLGTLVIPASILSFGLPIMIAVTILYFIIAQDREVTQWEGWLLIVFYIFFIGKNFAIF